MRYDTTLKELFQTPPTRLLTLLAGATPVELLTVEYPAVKMRRPDLVYRLPDGEIHQLEVQSDNDEEMDWRMLEYYPLRWRQFQRPPVQQVLYVGSKPLTMTGRLEHEHLQFRYQVLDIRDLDAAPLLASQAPADNLLAILCRQGARRESVRRILRRIARLPQRQRLDRLTQLLILSGLRQAEELIKEEVQQMPFEIDIMENSFLRGIFLDGEKQGEERGKVGLLRRQLEHRFGRLPKWAVAQLEAADAATLEEWGLRLLEAESLEEVVPRGRGRRRR